MKPVTEHRKFDSIEDYLAFEERSELRHEYYSENLISGTINKLDELQVSIALKDIYQA